MTETEQRMYDLIAKEGVWAGTAAFGWAMWPDGRSHCSPQGMALAAGKVLRRLIDAGLIKQVPGPNCRLSVYRVVHVLST
ncbi:MAG: hypothetical protein ABL885_06210 [Methylophilaceae bacterium]